jgi:hypothetical protein
VRPSERSFVWLSTVNPQPTVSQHAMADAVLSAAMLMCCATAAVA